MEHACTLTQEEYEGWKAIRLSNGIIELFIVPEIGGRIIQLRLGSRNFFYVNSRHQGRIYGPDENCFTAGWKNYGGSKVWPAPQGWETDGQWPGPPDSVLDGGPYSWRVEENTPERAAISLESQPDEYTGLTFSREIRLSKGSSTVHILHKMRNSSSRAVRWAIWQVTQHAADRPLRILAPAHRYRQMFGDTTYDHVEVNSAGGLWKLEYANQVAKFAVEVEQGWLVALKPEDKTAMVEGFELFPGSIYPDGAPVEIWVDGAGTFTVHGDQVSMEEDSGGCDPHIETEILSPLVKLDPGQEFNFSVTWYCTAIPSPTVRRVNSCALISEPLTVKAASQRLQVASAFGIFHAGSVELVSLHRNGKLMDTVPLGKFTPLEPCHVDKTISCQNGLGRLSLRLRDSAGRLMGTIDEVCLFS